MAELVPEVKIAAATSAELALRVRSQENVLERASQTVGSVGQVLPVLGKLAVTSHEIFNQARSSGDRIEKMLAFMPKQETLLADVREALNRVDSLTGEVRSLSKTTQELRETVREQGTIVRRMDTTLWNTEKNALLAAADDVTPGSAGPASKP